MIILCFLRSKVTLNKILSLYSRNFVKWKMSKSYMEIRWQHLHKDFTKCCIAKLCENKTSHTHSFVKCHISWRKIKNWWTNYFRKIVKGFDETWAWIDRKKQKQKNAGHQTSTGGTWWLLLGSKLTSCCSCCSCMTGSWGGGGGGTML